MFNKTASRFKAVAGLYITSLAIGGYALAGADANTIERFDANSLKLFPAPKDHLVVFFTGNTLGQLKPCGCSGGQLGGFDRRKVILDSVPVSNRLSVDTGNFISKNEAQDLIKFDIMFQALAMCSYDVVNTTEADLKVAQNHGLADQGGLNLITSHSNADVNIPQVFMKSYDVNSMKIKVMVTSSNADKVQMERALGLVDANAIKILIVNNGTKLPDFNDLKGFDIAVVRAFDTDTPMVLQSKAPGKPMVITAGNRGKYVGTLAMSFLDKGPQFEYKAIPVSEDLPADKSLVDLYKTYQQIVKDENLLEKNPRFVLPDKLEYVGSKTCGRKGCHEYEHKMWSTKKHAQAWESLVKVGSDYDPECVICHVVGFEYKSGFVSPDKPGAEDLKNVGCENCHGAGSKHTRYAGKVKTANPKPGSGQVCVNCHNADQSPRFSSHEKEYREKIVHWKEPNAPAGVKK